MNTSESCLQVVRLWWGYGDNEGQKHLFEMGEANPLDRFVLVVREHLTVGVFCVPISSQYVEEAGLVWERAHHITHIQM